MCSLLGALDTHSPHESETLSRIQLSLQKKERRLFIQLSLLTNKRASIYNLWLSQSIICTWPETLSNNQMLKDIYPSLIIVIYHSGVLIYTWCCLASTPICSWNITSLSLSIIIINWIINQLSLSIIIIIYHYQLSSIIIPNYHYQLSLSIIFINYCYQL